MSGSRRGVAAGAEYACISWYDSNGNPTGGTPLAPANGTASAARSLLGIKAAASVTPEPDIVPDTGDDVLLAEFDFDSNATRRYTATTAAFDLDLLGYLQSTSTVSLGDGLMGIEDIPNAIIPDTCLIVQSRTKKMDPGTEGHKAWSGFIEPICSTRFLGRDAYTERAAAVYNWSITPQAATQTPWGVTIQSLFGASSGRRMSFSYDNPIWHTVFYGNGSLAAVPVPHRPISAAKCFAYTIPAGYSTGGVAAPVASVTTTAPYTVVLQNAPPIGSKTEIWFEFDLFVKS